MSQELIDKIQELENKLEWRDAKMCPPTYKYPSEEHVPNIEFLVLTDMYVVELFSGEYNPETKEYIMERGFPIKGGPSVLCWRPFNFPDYGCWIGGCCDSNFKEHSKKKHKEDNK